MNREEKLHKLDDAVKTVYFISSCALKVFKDFYDISDMIYWMNEGSQSITLTFVINVG